MNEEQDYDSLRWAEMTGRMEKMTPEQRAAYRQRCEEHQTAAEEYIRKAEAIMERQQSENQM